ncbi:YeeE/YedE family protein [Candidatus Acetothermia bacterium]|nr:YeeE/YedE family protein [Candidatus Acetothermia bacterium]
MSETISEQTEITESKIPRRSSSRTTARKPKKSRVPLALALTIVIIALVAFGLYLATVDPRLSLFWLIGLCFGFILQRARFCFTASLRDPTLTGGTSLTKAVLIAFAITSVGFVAIQYNAYRMGLPIPGAGYILPISLATVIGGFLFGIGMVIGGGCGSGTLMRVGEGFHMNMLVLVFFIIGLLVGSYDHTWWQLNVIQGAPRVHLPDVFGWFGAITIQLIVIGALYILADRWESRRKSL